MRRDRTGPPCVGTGLAPVREWCSCCCSHGPTIRFLPQGLRSYHLSTLFQGREMSIKRLCIMGNFGQAAVGLIILLVVVGGLLYIYYSRTNAVEKNGYGALIMLSIVSLMIPTFWILESSREAAQTTVQFEQSIARGMVVYANNCAKGCYG